MAPTAILVDNTTLLDSCLSDITSNETTKLAIDLEGVGLCRNGRISLLQILANNSSTIWLVDVTVLGKVAFDHTNESGQSLRNVLQSFRTQKTLYDLRNDADALWNLYGVELANTYDLQILEVASRRSANLRVKFLCSLSKAIDTYINPSSEWKHLKEAGCCLFVPAKGGSYDIFERRPLDPRIQAYSAQDVELLFELERVLESRLVNRGWEWKNKVVQISAQRVAEAHLKSYSGHGMHRAMAPIFGV